MYLSRSSKYGGSRFYDLGYELNGFGKLAECTSAAVSQLCGLSSASGLTLLKWRDVFPPRELLRWNKAWCPVCLDECDKASSIVYEPLLWSIKLFDSCTKHGIPLETSCPSCEKTIPVLSTRRHNIIMPVLEGKAKSTDIIGVGFSDRTIRNWVKDYKYAEEIYGRGFIGLIPKIEMRGNRRPRLSDCTLQALDLFICENETVVNQSKTVLYGKFRLLCQEKGLDTPSIKTFYKRINERPQILRLLKTQGSRVAYQKEPFYFELCISTPRHGERPFEIAHIDHTLVDLVTTHSQTGKALGKAWLSIRMLFHGEFLPFISLMMSHLIAVI